MYVLYHSTLLENRLICFVFIIVVLFPIYPLCGLYAQVFRGYYPSGAVQLHSNKQDKKNIIKGYYPNGKLEFVYEYENNALNGKTRQYYENGILKAEINYRNDKRQGMAKYYYQSGMLMARMEFSNDLEIPPSHFYDENGKAIKSPPQK